MPDTLDISCPSCGKALKVPAKLEGKRVKCKGCQEAFLVTAPPPAAKSPPPPPAAPKRPFDDDDDDDMVPGKPIKQIGVVAESDVPRCPHCAVELDPPDALVCSNCGFNNRTRVKAELKKIWAPEFADWASHLAPGIIALLLVIGLIVLDIVCLNKMTEWLTGSDLQEDTPDPITGSKKFLVRPGAFTALIWAFSLVVIIPAVRFAYRRLVIDYRPEEQVKK